MREGQAGLCFRKKESKGGSQARWQTWLLAKRSGRKSGGCKNGWRTVGGLGTLGLEGRGGG